MNADMKWLDNPEVFRVNQLEAHSDHTYYESYEALEKKENALIQSLNGQWEFAFSKNVKSRPENFYEEDFDAKNFDKIMVPGHIELAGYDGGESAGAKKINHDTRRAARPGVFPHGRRPALCTGAGLCHA